MAPEPTRSLTAARYWFHGHRQGRYPTTRTLRNLILNGLKLPSGDVVKLRAIRGPGGWRVAESWVREFEDAATRGYLQTVAAGVG